MLGEHETERYQNCERLIDEGKSKEALALAESLSDAALRAAILIDAGLEAGKPGKVREGAEMFETMLSNNEDSTSYAKYSLMYNAANGYSSLFTLKRREKKSVVPPNDNDLRKAKHLYREALRLLNNEGIKGSFLSQVLVNYGNCLSQLGRFVEAIECYQSALKACPENGMAAGNLGVELEYASRLVQRHRHEYIGLAHALLSQALGPEMHLRYGSADAARGFQHTLARLQAIIEAHREPILPPMPVTKFNGDKHQQDYVRFCLENGLFLNTWVGDSILSPAVTDDIALGAVVTPVGDDHLVPELLHILNEIKEAYATARYIFYLSQEPSVVLNKLSEMTLYFDGSFAGYEIYGLYAGLCKTAYSRAFDVLDKTARIINVYFDLGTRHDSFWRILVERQSLGEEKTIRFAARPAVSKRGNHGLFALADLCIDYFESEHVDLKTIDQRRNRITHDYLNLRLWSRGVEESNEDHADFDDFQQQTKSVFSLAKSAILYTVSAIAQEEDNSVASKHVLSIPYSSYPGRSFL